MIFMLNLGILGYYVCIVLGGHYCGDWNVLTLIMFSKIKHEELESLYIYGLQRSIV